MDKLRLNYRLYIFCITIRLTASLLIKFPASSEESIEIDQPIPSFSYNQTHEVIAGSNVMLSCDFETLGGLLNGTWSKGDEILTNDFLVLSEDARINVILEYNLKIDKVTPHEYGIYECRLNHYHYFPIKRFLYILQIYENKPKKDKRLYSFDEHHYLKFSASLNDTAVLPCQGINLVSGKDSMRWYPEYGATLKSERRYKNPKPESKMRILSGYTLEIQNVNSNDSNIDYVCKLQHPITKESYGTVIHKLIVSEPRLNTTMDKCSPSPCGLNTECKPNGEYPECACRPDFKGNPHHCAADCKKGNCPTHIACINDYCKNLYAKSCGLNANRVIEEYKYKCTCLDNYYGNPYHECRKSDKIRVPTMKTENKTYEVIRNESIILSCEASSSDRSSTHTPWWIIKPANASYQRYIKPPEPRIRINSRHNLQIENVTHADEGFYVCRLKNNTIQNITYKLEILDASNNKHAATIPFTLVRVKENDTIVLPCEGVNNLDGNLMTWIEIYFKFGYGNGDYMEIPIKFHDQRIKILSSTDLEIQNVQPEDAGTYSCFLIEKNQREEGRILLGSHKLKVLDSETRLFRSEARRRSAGCFLKSIGELVVVLLLLLASV